MIGERTSLYGAASDLEVCCPTPSDWKLYDLLRAQEEQETEEPPIEVNKEPPTEVVDKNTIRVYFFSFCVLKIVSSNKG